jgi:hypothetical protein
MPQSSVLVGEIVIAGGLVDGAVEQGRGGEQQRCGERQVALQRIHAVLPDG